MRFSIAGAAISSSESRLPRHADHPTSMASRPDAVVCEWA
jgi:hypothetical protein